MNSVKNTIILTLISVIIMATVGYPLGIIPALLVLCFVAFSRAIIRVMTLRQQRPMHHLSNNIWLRNAERLNARSRRQSAWHQNISYLIAMLLGCNIINIGFLLFGEVIPPLKAATAVCAILTIRSLVFLRLNQQ